ncbi:hypothetical protein BBJ28_00025368 [Nothophytophthora sp. Chile5]|nr:hypothetical protein BBJ28_00025368 [Nothophytophthora sp. Chile5]
MWATGGNPNAVPMPRVARHWWTDTGSNISYVVTAVHTLALDDEPAYDNCAVSTQNGGYGSLVLPCHTKANISAAIEKDMQTVEGSPWVSRWLVEDYPDAAVTASTEDSEGFSLVLLVPIIGGVLAFTALLLIGVCCRRKRRERARKAFEQSTSSQHTLLTSPIERSEQRHPPARPTVTVSDDTTTDTYIGGDQTIQIPPGYREDYSNRGSNAPFKLLLTSEYLTGKRIAFDSLVFVKALSSGSSGEVWLCDYADQQVACKRLLHSKGQKAEDVHDFVQEIELNASLQHPNIGAFIGVAWSSLDNLEMVIEYFPMGDLQRYLQKNFDLLSWAKDKIHMAIGVAQALGYLHSRTPPLIHRDLKSKNIMLTRQLEPKLIDFGVSRGRMDSTMTAGVGTPYWTAPEILEGKHYTEQADIYSFGVVLSELDTCKIPFHNFLSTGGTNVKPFQILQEVMTGTLRPSFSEECPPRIRRVGVACCQQDPARRPTAAQLVRMLQSE